MSLRIWLPMNHDLRNQGLDNVTITNHGATFNSAGKLGGCYKTSSTATIDLGYNGNQINSGSISFGGWFKFNKAELWSVMSSYSYTSTRTTPTGNLIGNNSYGGVSLQWYTNNIYNDNTLTTLYVQGYLRSTTNGAKATSGVSLPFDTWVHIFFTFDKLSKVMTIWLNGEAKYTFTNLEFTDAVSRNLLVNYSAVAGGNGPSFNIPFLINDVRIYDHCLSPMEVKELAKGLILHYPLNRQGLGQENLLLNSTIPTSGSGATGVTKSITEDGIQKVVAASGNRNWCTFNNHNTTLNLTKGDTFTFSLMIKSNDSIKKPTVYFQNGLGYYSMQGTMSSHWSIIYYTGVWSIDNLTTNIHLGFSSAPGTYYIKYFKLEKGDKVTPWAPNHTDELYTTMGLNSTTEYDCSGFCNNGTWHGIRSYTSDTAKYSVSTTATGSGTTYLEGVTLPAEAKTVALWIKNTNKSSNGAIFNDKTTGLQIGLLNSLLYMNSKASTAGFTTTHWINGEWNHVVAINNNGTRSLYVNGQAETQSGASNYYIHNADNFWVWNRSYNNNYPFTGSLCDLRIYATALSASDVKSLYQNCATIDPDGTIRGQIRS